MWCEIIETFFERQLMGNIMLTLPALFGTNCSGASSWLVPPVHLAFTDYQYNLTPDL